MNRPTTFFLAAAFSLLAACGAPPLTAQTACEDQVAAQCAKMWNCPNAVLKIGNDEASCKTQYKALCSLAASGCESPKTFDPMAAAACRPALEAQSCDDFAKGAPQTCKDQCK